jgi:hypothetical protein
MQILCAMKKSLSVVEIINGANVKIVGAKGLGLEAAGSGGGGPLHIAGTEKGVQSDTIN